MCKISNFLSKIQFQINRDPALVCTKKKPVASGRILGLGADRLSQKNTSSKLAESVQNSVVFTVCFLVQFNERHRTLPYALTKRKSN